MSENVSNSLVNRDPDQALLELDRLEFSTDNVTQFSLFRGPFGVSKIDQSPETDQTSPEDESVILPVEDWLVEPSVFSSTIRESEDTGFIDTFSDILNTGSPIWEPIPTTAENTEKHVPTPQLPLDILPITTSGSTEAWSILSHYRDRVVPLISPFENGQEVPWRNLIIPCAVSTLGETFMNDSSSHARLALLNALLSASSFHLGQHSTMCIEHWTMAGSSYLKLAQHHLMKCIEDADMIHPRKSKYKEVLMALLSLSTAYVCIDCQWKLEILLCFPMLMLDLDDKGGLREAIIVSNSGREIYQRQWIYTVHCFLQAKGFAPLLRLHAHYG